MHGKTIHLTLRPLIRYKSRPCTPRSCILTSYIWRILPRLFRLGTTHFWIHVFEILERKRPYFAIGQMYMPYRKHLFRILNLSLIIVHWFFRGIQNESSIRYRISILERQDMDAHCKHLSDEIKGLVVVFFASDETACSPSSFRYPYVSSLLSSSAKDPLFPHKETFLVVPRLLFPPRFRICTLAHSVENSATFDTLAKWWHLAYTFPS